MPKIVILGSCKHEPYEVLAVPDKIPNAWNTEKGYELASKKFYPAIDKADIVFVYAPKGIGEHTQRDIDYALSKGKWVVIAKEEAVRDIASSIQEKLTKLRNLKTYGNYETKKEELLLLWMLKLLVGSSPPLIRLDGIADGLKKGLEEGSSKTKEP